MTTTFYLRKPPTVPLEAEVLSPDVIDGLSVADIRSLILHYGRRQVPLSEFFDVEGDGSEHLVLHGDLSRVRRIGSAMSRGRITVHGSVGMHLGVSMKGGWIEVHGDADDWVGAEMKNGHIHIHGNAGNQVGAAYRGTVSGMKNGTILVDGSVGQEVGLRMRRGTIVVGGSAGEFAGVEMKGGTIILQQGAERCAGAGMKRGTIVSMKPLSLLPTFAGATEYNPAFLNVYATQLRQYDVNLPFAASQGRYHRHVGDFSVPGKGEILIWRSV